MEKKEPIVDLSQHEKRKNPFFLGDVKEAGKDSFLNVIIPAAQRIVVDTARNWIETLVYGAPRSGSSSSSRTGYSSIFKSSSSSSSSQNRTEYSKSYQKQNVLDFNNYFDEDMITDEMRKNGISCARELAERVAIRLNDNYDRYGCYSVLDFCEATHQQCASVANDWGWTIPAQVVRSGRGYKIDLSEPISLKTI